MDDVAGVTVVESDRWPGCFTMTIDRPDGGMVRIWRNPIAAWITSVTPQDRAAGHTYGVTKRYDRSETADAVR